MCRAEKLQSEYGIWHIYNDYDEFLESDDFDWVYVGVETEAHFAFGKAALNGKKHVIIEKPMAGRLSQINLLYDAAVRNGCFLFESMSTYYMPLYRVMKEQIGRLKDVRIVICNFSKVSSAYEDYIKGCVTHRFDADGFGGALYDLNIYNINFAASIWGMPQGIRYFPNIGYNGADTSGVLLLTYKDFTVCCIAAKDSAGKNFIQVQGSNGCVYADGPANAFREVISDIDGRRDVFKEEISYRERLRCEIESISDIYERHDLDACRKIFENTFTAFRIIEKIAEKGPGNDGD